MDLETFKLVYLVFSILGSIVGVWTLRKNKNDLGALSLMSLVHASLLFAFYIDAKKGAHYGGLLEYLLTRLTHTPASLYLTVSNAFLWGVVPFSMGIWLRKRKNGDRLVWISFIAFAFCKALFDDRLLIHQYPELLTHQYEWGFVLFDWVIIYVLAALFITKGIASGERDEENPA